MKLSDAVKLYVELRDKRAELKRGYVEADTVLEQKMDKVEAALLKVMDETGMESIKTDAGTAYVSNRNSATVADRDTFLAFCKDNGEWSLMDIRASKTAIEQFKAANDDLPPGINWRSERVVNFRRAQ
jgi:hypothetical protein